MIPEKSGCHHEGIDQHGEQDGREQGGHQKFDCVWASR